jgi:hypothetical protein
MAAHQFAHAKLTSVSIGGTDFAGLQIAWDDGLSDLSDITYTQAGAQTTCGVFLPGYNIATGQIMFVWDTGNKPYLSPFNMRAGTLLAMVLNPDNASPISVSAYSGMFHFGGGPQLKSGVACSTDFTVTGNYTYPGS